MYKRILGRIKETNITDMELNWLYSALIVGQHIDPSYLMINRWCCEAISGSRDISLGVLPLHVGHLIKAGNYKESEISPRRGFLRN
jgi:hypothetical protein